MRIGQMVANYQAQNRLQMAAGGTSAAATAAGSTAKGADATKGTNQARLTDASKGYLQAAKVRDGVAEVSTAVKSASSLLDKAKATDLSAADRKQLQTDFAKALAAADQGTKDQSAALKDTSLANKTYTAGATTAVSADQLGKGASKMFSSVADLKKLDLSTASSEQLAEAAKVLDAAKTESTAQLATADARSQKASGQVDKYQAVQNALSGTGLSERQQRDLQAIKALTQQTGSMIPGSLYNTIG